MKLNLSRREFNLTAANLLVGSVAGASMLGAGSAMAQQKTVTVGYQQIVDPFVVAIANGTLREGDRLQDRLAPVRVGRRQSPPRWPRATCRSA